MPRATVGGEWAVSGRIFLVRHGRTALNADGRLRGHLNPPLDGLGELEVAALVAELAVGAVVSVLSSPLLRAMQTAEAIAQVSGVPVTAAPQLVDRAYGEWAGVSEADVVDRFGSLDAAPGVEPVTAVAARARTVLDTQRLVLDHGDVVLVAHHAVNKALLASIDPGVAERLRQPTACWNEIRHCGSRWTVTLTDQQPGLGATPERAER